MRAPGYEPGGREFESRPGFHPARVARLDSARSSYLRGCRFESGRGRQLEKWLRGRRQRVANATTERSARGFNSHLLRQFRGGCSQAAKAPGCDPGQRRFESVQLPHFHFAVMKPIGEARPSYGRRRRFDTFHHHHFSGRSSAWQSAAFGAQMPEVRILPPRPPFRGRVAQR